MPVTIVGNNTPTAGGVVYGDGTNYASTSAGTSGQMLVSGGSGAPTWAAAPGASAMTFISATTVSGTPSTVDLTSGINSTYDDYLVIFENVALSSATAQLLMQFFKSGSFTSALYQNGYIHGNFSASTVSFASGLLDAFTITRQSSTTGANRRSGVINLYNFNSTAAYASSCTYSAQNTGSSATGLDNTLTFGGGTEGTAAVVTQLRFLPSAGTFTSGTFRLYGIQKS